MSAARQAVSADGEDTIGKLADSPVRVELIRRLTHGDSAVWLTIWRRPLVLWMSGATATAAMALLVLFYALGNRA